ncbi:MAG: hypothetical protein KKH72_09370 [Alphaproteobacteria bacterium]|nr:hypothetical protein [Alphaproteobacteria bacterium]
MHDALTRFSGVLVIGWAAVGWYIAIRLVMVVHRLDPDGRHFVYRNKFPFPRDAKTCPGEILDVYRRWRNFFFAWSVAILGIIVCANVLDWALSR